MLPRGGPLPHIHTDNAHPQKVHPGCTTETAKVSHLVPGHGMTCAGLPSLPVRGVWPPCEALAEQVKSLTGTFDAQVFQTGLPK